jgi:hypothetical protein
MSDVSNQTFSEEHNRKKACIGLYVLACYKKILGRHDRRKRRKYLQTNGLLKFLSSPVALQL